MASIRKFVRTIMFSIYVKVSIQFHGEKISGALFLGETGVSQ